MSFTASWSAHPAERVSTTTMDEHMKSFINCILGASSTIVIATCHLITTQKKVSHKADLQYS
jgi:hypothetical protein